MVSLAISDEKVTKLDALENKAIEVVQAALDGNSEVDERAQMAMKTMSVVAKNRQTTTHRAAIEFTMASTIGSDKELKKYVAVTNPQIRKALAGKKS